MKENLIPGHKKNEHLKSKTEENTREKPMMRYKSRDREPLPTHLQLGVLVVSSRQSVGQHTDASQQEEEDAQSLHRGRCSSQMNDPANGASAFMCSAAAPSPFATSLSPAQSHVAWSGQVRTRGCG